MGFTVVIMVMNKNDEVGFKEDFVFLQFSHEKAKKKVIE